MKKNKWLVLIPLAVMFFLYAACGFITMELNPKNWDEAGRGIYVVLTVCFSVILGAIMWEEKP